MVFHSFPKITMMLTPNLFSNTFSFLVRCLVAIPVATVSYVNWTMRNLNDVSKTHSSRLFHVLRHIIQHQNMSLIISITY